MAGLLERRIAVVGATAGPGYRLFLRLAREGLNVLGVAKDCERVDRLGDMVADTNASVRAVDVAVDQRFTADVDVVVHCSRPDLGKRLLASHLERFIALGSTRKFTRFPDQRCRDVLELEAAAEASSVRTTVLHPTLIYGGPRANNVERVLATADRSPILPLPGGGLSLIQPVHAEDVAEAIYRCLTNDESLPNLVIAGPSPLTYRHFVEIILATTGRSARVIPLPYPVVAAGAVASQWWPGSPTIDLAEVRRLTEDKHFDVLPMQRSLGFIPRDFESGMRDYAAEWANG